MTGIQVFLEILSRAGIQYIFGNPGTTELPLNDVLATDSHFRYIFGLQEIPVVAMADGYAMASGQVGVANVHISCGLGNSMGMLYNAHVEGSPLLLTAGQQDRRLRFDEPVLDGDLLQVVRPWTKWAADVQRVEDIPNAVRRAIQTALTPPTGPVFLSLPVDLQSEPAPPLDLTAPSVLNRRVRPPLEALRRAAPLLAAARNPVILAGSRVTESGAGEELAALADLLGAPVYAESTTLHGRLPMASDHPLYRGILPLWSPDMRQRLAEFDVALAVGLNVFRLYIYHEPARPLPESLRLIHLDNNPREIGKNFPVEVGLLGDPKCGLSELRELLAPLADEQAAVIAKRKQAYAELRRDEQDRLLSQIEEQRGLRPMSSLSLMGTLAKLLPPDTAIVEEAITTHQNVLERLGVIKDPANFFAHRGWALGWGLGCALGVKLAWPHKPVVALLGDGAALYGIQGLWTAAHHRIPVTFIVANNAQYKILKVCADVMPLPNMAKKNYLAMDLTKPEIDFVGLARAFGVEAHRVGEQEELSEGMRGAFREEKPLLLEVRLKEPNE
jgi:benzoylformate decarboxylase